MTASENGGGALAGIRVLEIGSLAPGPFCAMMLADHGADVLRIERPGKAQHEVVQVHDDLVATDVMSRGRLSAGIDLKHPDGAALVRRLSRQADVVIEGFRPGVAERLGLGPDDLRADHPELVYGRITGWGRRGALAHRAGHDINYASLAGAQAHIGRAGQPPTPPLNLVADFGGGGLLLAFGICAALVSRASTGQGQVVDAAMVDGVALLMAPLFGAHAAGFWNDERGTNVLDSGAPFYDCYECADGRFVSVGAIEAQFYADLLVGLGLADSPNLPDRDDPANWPVLRPLLAERFLTADRDEWVRRFAHLDACVTPVLTMGEAPSDPHLQEWGTFVEVGGVIQPAPAPRLDGTPAPVPAPAHMPGADTEEVLTAWGVAAAEIAALRQAGAVA